MFLRPITPSSVVQRDETARAALGGKTKPETTLIAATNAIILNRFILSLRIFATVHHGVVFIAAVAVASVVRFVMMM
jgi:hypothetical protein